MKDLMIDIETLATVPSAVVLQIGAVEFDSAAGTMGRGKVWDLDYVTAQEYRTINPETLNWWVRQSQRAIERVLARLPVTDVVVMYPEAALSELADMVEAADRVWARGPNFDLSILNSLASECGYEPDEYIKWYKWRDERSIRDMLVSCKYDLCPSVLAHSALDDAIGQAHNVLRAFEIMRGTK